MDKETLDKAVVIKAAQLIKDFCDGWPSCNGCPFWRYDSDRECAVNQNVAPWVWEV